ncbi:MAG: DUF6265 family protein [Acidobacteriota bacterium]
MSSRSLVVIIASVLLVALSARPLDAGEAETSSVRLLDLAWMAGTWSSEKDGRSSEEHWMPPRGGLMLGLHRDVAGPGRFFFEYLRIEERPDGIVYLASPGGSAPTPFHLVESRGRRVVFENLEHDFPQRIVYWRVGKTLRARVEDASGEKGMDLSWKLEGRRR